MPRTERSAKRTTDHDEIRSWVDEHGGHPAAVKRTGRGDDPGILRIDFPGFSGEGTLEAISWDTFFEWFDRNQLAFLYQDVGESRFNKLVRRRASRSSRPGASRQQGKSAGRQASKQGEAVLGSEAGRVKGPNAIRLLEHQHREVEALFDEFEGAQDKRAMFEEIADAVAAHSEIEERIFYPTVLMERTEKELRESVEEHLAVKRIIADLMSMKPEDPQFEAKVLLMQELFSHHVEEEEHRLFEEVERIDTQALESLGEMMETAWNELIEQQPRKMIPRETSRAAQLPS